LKQLFSSRRRYNELSESIRERFGEGLMRSKKQVVVEELQWKQMAEAVARVMWPAAEES
jgi:hypothetical protein